MKTLKIAGFMLGVLLVGMPTTAEDFSSWATKVRIQFSGYDRSEPLTNFPALVVLGVSTFGYTLADLPFESGEHDDLRFTDATQTNALPYEIEKWDSGGEGYVWVQVPKLTNNATIWAFWGKEGQVAPSYTTNGAAWDADQFRGVWHLATGAALSTKDSSQVGAADGTLTGTVGQGSGIVDGAAEFLADSSAVVLADRDEYSFGNGLTDSPFSVSAWVNMDDATLFRVLSKYDGTPYQPEWNLGVGNSDTFTLSVFGGLNENYRLTRVTTNALTGYENQWTHLAATYDGSGSDTGIRLYVNGELAGSTDANVNPGSYVAMDNGSDTVTIGWMPAGGGGYSPDGTIDEVRLESGVRSSNWVWACYMNQASNTSFQTYALETGVRYNDFSEWERRLPIRFSGYDRPEPLTNFPALVVLGSNIQNFAYDTFLSDDHADLRFTDADQSSALAYEVEKWDTNGSSYVWVQVPKLTNNATIWAFWGRAGATTPSYTTNGEAWDADRFKGVWHLATDGSTLSARDSSPVGAADGTIVGVTATNGVIDGAGEFPGVDGDLITLADRPEYTFKNDATTDSPFTISAWVNMDNSARFRLLTKYQTAGTPEWFFTTTSDNDLFCRLYDQVTSVYIGRRTTATVTTYENQWAHMAMTYDGTSSTNGINLYINGAVVESDGESQNNYVAMHNLGSPVELGGGAAVSAGADGTIDEVRLESGVRSTNWLWACYMNQDDAEGFASYGPIEKVARGTLISIR